MEARFLAQAAYTIIAEEGENASFPGVFIRAPAILTAGAGVEVLGGLYNLTLPAEQFNALGIYTLYLRPAQIRTVITDCGVLSALPNVKGIVIDLTNVPVQYQNKFVPQGLVGFRIEYLNPDGSKIPNFFRVVTSSFFCEPVVTNEVNTTQKSVRYRYVDGDSNLLFLTLSPSSSPDLLAPTVSRFVSSARLQNHRPCLTSKR